MSALKTARFFVLLFIALSIVPFLYMKHYQQTLLSEHATHIERDNLNNLQYSVTNFQQFFSKVSSSLEVLAFSDHLKKAVKTMSKEDIAIVSDMWRVTASSLGVYSKIRFVDTLGQERIRVNYSNGAAYSVPESELQDKSHSTFFQNAHTIKPNEIRHVRVGLEMEFRKIVTPLMPALRIIVPIDEQYKESSSFQRHGYFIVNIDIEALYNSLSYDSVNYVPTIVNNYGFIVLSPDNNEQFLQLQPQRAEQTLKKSNLALWQSMQKQQIGTYFDGKEWSVFSKFMLTRGDRTEAYYMIFNGKNPRLDASYRKTVIYFYQNCAYLFIILVMLTGGITYWYSNHQRNSIDSMIARAAMDGMSAMIVTDSNNKIIKVNKQFSTFCGYDEKEIIGQSPSLFSSGKHTPLFYADMWKRLHNEGVWEGEVTNRKKDGSEIIQILRIHTVVDKNDDIQFYVASFVDITERKQLEDQLRELSEKDSLSGCWNRRRFDNELNTLSVRTARYPDKETACLAIVDIDFFKQVNDLRGHDEGDAVIRSVAQCIIDDCRESDFIARVGGEEFAIILPHTNLVEAEMVLNRVKAAVQLSHDNTITISGGITVVGAKASETYKEADIALYKAKSNGRNRIEVSTEHAYPAVQSIGQSESIS